jgi:signal transduction histidine kinase
MCAFDEATPSFVTLVREMDGQVPAPTLCVDSTGRIHAAALPGALGLAGDLLEGRRLATLLVDSDTELPSVRADLEEHGRRRARICLEAVRGPCALEADLVCIDRARDDSPLESRSERLIADLTRSVESVAHDLKGPLASALGFAGLLDSQCSDRFDDAGRAYLANLRKNVHRVQALLEGLIEYTRARDCVLKRRFVEPLPIVEQIGAELKPELDDRRVELRLPEKLDPIWADSRRFQQVALNLIINAAHHMGQAQDAHIEIDVTRKSYGRFLVVSDNGQGLPDSTRAQILELFRSGGQLQGAGLGLSIVRRVMEAHGGFVEIDSEPGQGATFRAFFPDP